MRPPASEFKAELHTAHGRPSLRRGFTLIELMVSVAILLGIMAMIGMVFQSAGKASGRAKSDSALFRQLRTAAEVIGGETAGDLSGVKADPAGSGVIGIAGVEILAYSSPEDLASGRQLHNPNDTTDPNRFADLHRADVLMLLTDRDFLPYVYDQNVSGALPYLPTKLVVYGHADVGQLDSGGDWVASQNIDDGPAKYGYATSKLPACEWALSRRVIGFHNKTSGVPTKGTFPGIDFTDPSIPLMTLTSGEFLGLEPTKQCADVVRDGMLDFRDFVVSGFYKYSTDTANSGKPYPFYMISNDYPYFTPDGSKWYVLDHDGHWYKLDSTKTPPWYRTEANTTIVNAPNWSTIPLPSALQAHDVPVMETFPQQWFYNPKKPNRRTRLDASPPPSLSLGIQTSRLAGYFLPSCSDFKVEYTYDDPRELAVDSTVKPPVLETAGGLDINSDSTPDTPGPQPIRWQTVPNGQQWVWSRLSVEPNNRTDPFRWPRALRITIRAYGTGGASQGAVEQSIIHCW